MSHFVSVVGMYGGALGGLVAMLAFAGSDGAGGTLLSAAGLALWAGCGAAAWGRLAERHRREVRPPRGRRLVTCRTAPPHVPVRQRSRPADPESTPCPPARLTICTSSAVPT
jgi:hypothetical protein